MRTLKLIALSTRYHWDASRSTPVNFLAAVLGMIINNLIVLWGLWIMLFHGKPNELSLTLYFLMLNAMITIAWGGVCFVAGGLHELADYVESGSLEPMLSTPRHPLVLIGISKSLTPALGDVAQGSLSLAALYYLAPLDFAIRGTLLTVVSVVGCLALFILTGSIPFFVRRGSQAAHLVREILLSLSFYPSGKVFSGQARLLLYLTPAAATTFLPMEAVETGSLGFIAGAIAIAILFFAIALWMFSSGIKRYQSASYVEARS